MEYKIIERQITNQFGEVKNIATSLIMNVNYNPEMDFALGFYELQNEQKERVHMGNNIEIPVRGWGENDEFIFKRFAEIIGVTLIEHKQ